MSEIQMTTTSDTSFNLAADGLTVPAVHRNLPPSSLYEHAIRFEKHASIAGNGALVAYSGVKTGRSPKDKLALPHLVGGQGALARILLPLDEVERVGLRRSADILREAIQSLYLK
jgi:hypothetical protein